MKIAIGCDHGGFELKEDVKKHLIENNYEVEDFGCYDLNAVDYPDMAEKVSNCVVEDDADYGVLICSTGIGISIAANKVKGIRAALCGDIYSAKMTRLHNNANVLCMGAHMIAKQNAIRITDIFLSTEFEGGRHENRVNLITKIEEKN